MKKALDSFVGAVGMFTRLPTPYAPLLSDSTGLLRCLPVVGGLVGLLWLGLHRLLSFMTISQRVSGALLCVFPFIITGFMHLDGFMDVVDALMSGRDMEKRLRILKDPNTGAFSVCALGCLLIIEAAACTELAALDRRAFVLLWLPVFSRALASLGLVSTPLLEGSRLGRSFAGGSTNSDKILFAALALLSGGGLWLAGGVMVPLFGAAAWGFGLRVSVKGLGGSSGDVAGLCITLTEAVALLAAVL